MINYIGKTQIKQWLVEDLKSFLKQHGFKITPSVNVDIKKDEGDVIFHTFFSVSLTDDIGLGNGRIRFEKVENILYEITNLPVYNIGSKTITIFPDEKFGILATLAKNRSDVTNISESFKQVFIECFLPDFERYSEPKNVLELWDSLDEDGRTNHFFDPYNYTKILILSKLINEDKYENRKIETLELYEKLQATGKHYHLDKLENLKKVIRYIEKK